MSGVTQGTISNISVKDINPPDRWQNTYRLSFQLAEYPDIWFGCGGKKRPDIGIKEGSGYYNLRVGDIIQFPYTMNGEYYNVKTNTIVVVAKGNGPAAPAPSAPRPAPGPAARPGPAPAGAPPSPAGGRSGGAGGFDRRTLDIKIGRSVKIAAHLYTADPQRFQGDIKAALREAVRLEALADRYYTAVYDQEAAALNTPQAAAAPAQQPAPAPVVPTPAPQPPTPPAPAPVPQQTAPAPSTPSIPDDIDAEFPEDDIPF